MLDIDSARVRRILVLALPIIGGMVSQNVLNLVDTLMVAQLGADAVAAVGFGGFANFLATAFVTGLAAGVQAMAARRKGEGRTGEMAVPLNGGLLVVACISVPLSALLIAAVPSVFPVLASDPAVVEVGVPYLQARLVGMIAIGANFSFRGYWNGVGRSGLYLRTLLVMHVSNVAISYVLIFGKLGLPALGALGAGIGSAASAFLGTAYYVSLGRRHARDAGFLAALPSPGSLVTMLRLSVPSGLQSLLYAAGLTLQFVIIDRVGTHEVAAANVLVNITMVAFLPGLGLGLAAASLVGQALGRGDVEDAERWGWEVARIGAVIMFVLGLPMALVPELLLTPFFAEEPEALELASLPLRLSGLTIGIEALLMVLLNAMLGAGATRLALAVSGGMQWLVFLPIAYYVGPVLGHGLLGIWIAVIGYRALTAIVLAILWRSRLWAGAVV